MFPTISAPNCDGERERERFTTKSASLHFTFSRYKEEIKRDIALLCIRDIIISYKRQNTHRERERERKGQIRQLKKLPHNEICLLAFPS